jgi:hypothetical protein
MVRKNPFVEIGVLHGSRWHASWPRCGVCGEKADNVLSFQTPEYEPEAEEHICDPCLRNVLKRYLYPLGFDDPRGMKHGFKSFSGLLNNEPYVMIGYHGANYGPGAVMCNQCGEPAFHLVEFYDDRKVRRLSLCKPCMHDIMKKALYPVGFDDPRRS